MYSVYSIPKALAAAFPTIPMENYLSAVETIFSTQIACARKIFKTKFQSLFFGKIEENGFRS